MKRLFGWMPGIVSMAQGPWGGKSDGPESNDGSGGKGAGGDGGPRNPWTQPGRPVGQKGPSAIEEMLRRGRDSFGQGGGNGGGFGGLPQRPNGKALWPIGSAFLSFLGFDLTSFHVSAPRNAAVAPIFGVYTATVLFNTLPAHETGPQLVFRLLA